MDEDRPRGLRTQATALALALVAAAAPAALAGNQIRAENALPGTVAWHMPPAHGRAIEGYASEVSAAPGSRIVFHVSTMPAARYRILVFRLGWYGGRGARLLDCLPGCRASERGSPQPVPRPDANGRVRARWPVTDTLTVPPEWVSGYYLVRFVLTSGPDAGRGATTFLVVTEPWTQASAILVQVPVNTWEAYNAWGGKSLYDFSSTGGSPANRVSFDRPFQWSGPGAQGPLGWEYPLVQFLERGGYDVSYQTDVDTDRDPASLLRHRLVMTAGHGEYWTKATRDAFEAARGAGTNLAFLGANTGYWQVRYEDGRRTIVAYKSLYDPNPDPALKTARFRELTPPRYECELLGVQHQGVGLHWPPSDYVVDPAGSGDPWFAGTGFTSGGVVKGIVSVESDTIPGNQSAADDCGHSVTVLFRHDVGSDKDGNADAVRYTDPSGARVFAAGSLQFSWGLSDLRADPEEGHGLVDPRLQRFTRNALDDLTRPAAPTAVAAAEWHEDVRVWTSRHEDPRVERVEVFRHPGDAAFSPGDPGAIPVCVTTRRMCVDRDARPGAYRYLAVTVDRWRRSAPVLSTLVTVD